MRFFSPIFVVLCALFSTASAQFNFFDHVFGGGGQQQRQQPQNVPSDSSIYRNNFDSFQCDNYLCPDTLACVHFPHHCPCPFPAHQDKFEMGTGHRICTSKSGYKPGDAARKVELARKGML